MHSPMRNAQEGYICRPKQRLSRRSRCGVEGELALAVKHSGSMTAFEQVVATAAAGCFGNNGNAPAPEAVRAAYELPLSGRRAANHRMISASATPSRRARATTAKSTSDSELASTGLAPELCSRRMRRRSSLRISSSTSSVPPSGGVEIAAARGVSGAPAARPACGGSAARIKLRKSTPAAASRGGRLRTGCFWSSRAISGLSADRCKGLKLAPSGDPTYVATN